jgi:hypothetical protein
LSSTTPSGGATVMWPGPLSMSISSGACTSSLSASLHAQPHAPHGVDDPVKGRAGRSFWLNPSLLLQCSWPEGGGETGRQQERGRGCRRGSCHDGAAAGEGRSGGIRREGAMCGGARCSLQERGDDLRRRAL